MPALHPPASTASVSTAIAITGLFLLGTTGTSLNSIHNRLFDLLTITAADLVNPYIPGGPSPYFRDFTGIKPIDITLGALNGFFCGLLDGDRTWDVDLSYWHTMSMLGTGFALLGVEGLRRGNQGLSVARTNLLGALFQLASYSVACPLYLLLHIFTSPTVSHLPGNLSWAEVVSVNERDVTFLPLFTVLSFFIPTVLMSLPSPSVLSGKVHYTWAALWQLFPFWHYILQQSSSIFNTPSPKQTRTPNRSSIPDKNQKVSHALKRHYQLILTISTITNLTVLLITLTSPSLLPLKSPNWLFSMVQESTFSKVFIPAPLWNPPSIDSTTLALVKVNQSKVPADWLPVLVKHFLQYDIYAPSLAVFVWAGYALASASVQPVAMSPLISKRLVLAKTCSWFLVGGPIAAATFLMWERDEVVLKSLERWEKAQ
ncbi:hypothetical protein QBC35DRAFT_141341 [Podospora australis]|uniref:Uncharacterized protein n=1 Tax=Podospora australis TaxID=1536484 RepID=A0AAN6WWV4_9PEZI|nr:hypothetical protein QBC35DRAFT_141341 [Podospora australis]